MAIVLDDPEVESLAQQLANVRRSDVAEALIVALREQLLREQHNPGRKPISQVMDEIRAKMHGAPRYHADKTDDELLGYNEYGHFD